MGPAECVYDQAAQSASTRDDVKATRLLSGGLSIKLDDWVAVVAGLSRAIDHDWFSDRRQRRLDSDRARILREVEVDVV